MYSRFKGQCFLQHQPLHFTDFSLGLRGNPAAGKSSILSAVVNWTCKNQHRVLLKSKGPHHGGAGVLPRGCSDVFFWRHASVEGRPGGAGRPGVDECVLSVCAGSTTVSGDRRIHRHGYVPDHSSGLLQRPALEENQRVCEGEGITEEDKVKNAVKTNEIMVVFLFHMWCIVVSYFFSANKKS